MGNCNSTPWVTKESPTLGTDTQTHPGGGGGKVRAASEQWAGHSTVGHRALFSSEWRENWKTSQRKEATTCHPYRLLTDDRHSPAQVDEGDLRKAIFWIPDDSCQPGFFFPLGSVPGSATLKHTTAATTTNGAAHPSPPGLWAAGDGNDGNNNKSANVDSLTHWCRNPRLSGGLTPLG